MLYRLSPPATLEWADVPRQVLDLAAEHDADLDRLDWKPTEDRMFSSDMLRIAVRHGVPTGTGLVLDVRYTLDLGRADQLRLNQIGIGEAQAKVREQSGELMERLMPGWTQRGDELDEQVRASSERVAREAEDELAKVMAAPVREDLVDHWRARGGHVPD